MTKEDYVFDLLRSKFEKLIRSLNLGVEIELGDDGNYTDPGVQTSWQGYMAGVNSLVEFVEFLEDAKSA